jgi:LPXTG-motif cell wall-anchored protein
MVKPLHAYPFIALGVVFIALGATGKNAFYAIGIVFLALGFIILVRSRRS